MVDDIDDARPPTHLQRAFSQFLRVAPDPLSPRALAALMRIETFVAYNYIARLKRAGCIRPVANSSYRFPEYEIVPGAQMPPGDGRGRKRNPKASRPISQFTVRRVHLIR